MRLGARGRRLTHDDMAHCKKIAFALSATFSLLAETDRVIVELSAWPAAVQNAKGVVYNQKRPLIVDQGALE